MALGEKDLEDVRFARPISVTDLWDIDDRIDRFENCLERLEKCIQALAFLDKEERVKGWQVLLEGMLKEEKDKVRRNKPIFEVEDNNPKPIFEEKDTPESTEDMWNFE